MIERVLIPQAGGHGARGAEAPGSAKKRPLGCLWERQPSGLRGLQRTQEVQHVLLLLRRETVEVPDDAICFRTLAEMLFDGIEKIRGAAIVEEENALSDAPERRRAELIRPRASLGNTVSEACPHMVDKQIRKEIRLRLIQVDHE